MFYKTAIANIQKQIVYPANKGIQIYFYIFEEASITDIGKSKTTHQDL